MDPATFVTSSRDEQEFRPLVCHDGYLPIADHGLIGDGTTAALVGLDGTISWLCLPRFDGDAIFCSILDQRQGGSFSLDVGQVHGARHRYFGDSSVLITELKVEGAVIRVTDLMPMRRGADLTASVAADVGELLRVVEIVEGEATVGASVAVQGGVRPERERNDIRLRLDKYPDVDLVLEASRELQGAGGEWRLRKGESVTFCLRWNGGTGASSVESPVAAITNTVEGWTAWLESFHYQGPQRSKVLRSAITIKMLDYLANGALIAAPTSSLPEHIGGERNWDYRYVWVRDASFAVYALRRIGLDREAWQFLSWMLGLIREYDVHIMYTLDGNPRMDERIDPSLEGYRGSSPVRWGNGAHGQVQHDVYGELLDCAFQWSTHGGRITERLWKDLSHFVDRAAEVWTTPDQGIWEVRSQGTVQTYSAGLCQVALDRGARLARRFGLPGDVDRWERTARTIQETILTSAWDEDKGYLTQSLRGGHLDAAILGLPIRRVLPSDHPRVMRTVQAVDDVLGAGDGLIYRYLPDKSPDGLQGEEGAFVLCSFWMIDNLTLQGRIDEAQDRFERMCNRANILGLLPEEIDPSTGDFLGNFPQAFSHLGMISSGFNLERTMRRLGVSPNGRGDDHEPEVTGPQPSPIVAQTRPATGPTG
ncbi:MAG: glycoside hydrolase family 15 protein [Chloroflexia bacterium]|nr:glycoside hydrolase family 15 protein [Chloroflexia bacterium]